MPQQVATGTGQPPGGRSDGRGRATGPSFSLGSLARVALAAVLTATVAARFAFESAGVRTLAPAAIALATALGSAVGLVLGLWRHRMSGFSRTRALALFALGAGGFALSPLVVASNRMSDAPSGSEVLFLTTAGWAATLSLTASLRDRSVWHRLAGSVLTAAGVAGVVANWERPSSFSLFVRYRFEESMMLVAGLLWAAMWLLLDRAAREGRLREGAVASSAGAFAGGLALAVSRWQSGGIASAVGNPAWWAIAALSAAIAALGVILVERAGSRSLAAAWFLPAVALTGLTAIEQAVQPFGIQPILLTEAAAGGVIAIAGATVVASRPEERDGRRLEPQRLLPARAAAAAALILGVTALVTPALAARVSAIRADGSAFQASFTLLGLETVGGWVVLGLALTAVVCAWRPVGVRRVAAVALVAALAFPAVWATPLHTLSSAIPWEIQVDYGSEYAHIAFSTLTAPWMWASFASAVLALAVLLWSACVPRGQRVNDRSGAS